MAQKQSPEQLNEVIRKINETAAAGNITGEEKVTLLGKAPEIASEIAKNDGFSSSDVLSDSAWESWLFSHQNQY